MSLDLFFCAAVNGSSARIRAEHGAIGPAQETGIHTGITGRGKFLRIDSLARKVAALFFK